MDRSQLLPLLEAHLIALGKTGAGKSYALRVLLETLLDANRRICIIDPKGDHWGIKSSADGKKAGYKVIIFGGDHQDVPLNPRAGKDVAELIATGNRPAVIDFRGWMPGERTKFWLDFASRLFTLNRQPLWLAIDEVHNFAPQGKTMDPEAAMSLHWMNRLANEGRGMGIRLLMASQRPQKVHKDTITAAETLVAMRVIHKLDRDAIRDWMDGAGNLERSKLILNSLAEMQRGEAYVWSPEIKFFEHFRFPQITTFDSFKAPTENSQAASPKVWAEVNLDEVRERLSAVVEEAKANDPVELKQRIAELTRTVLKLEKEKGAVPDAARFAAEKKQIEETYQSYIHSVKTVVGQIVTSLEQRSKRTETLREITKALEEIESNSELVLQQAKELLLIKAPSLPKHPLQPTKYVDMGKEIVTFPKEPKKAVAHAPQTGHQLTNAQQRILDSLQWWKDAGFNRVTKEQVAIVGRFSPAGGHFGRILGSLRTLGLIEYPTPGEVSFAAEGAGIAHSDGEVTPNSLKDRIDSILEPPHRRIIDVLWDHRGATITKDTLADEAKFTAGGGHFGRLLGRLRTLTLIEYQPPDSVCLSQWIRTII